MISGMMFREEICSQKFSSKTTEMIGFAQDSSNHATKRILEQNPHPKSQKRSEINLGREEGARKLGRIKALSKELVFAEYILHLRSSLPFTYFPNILPFFIS